MKIFAAILVLAFLGSSPVYAMEPGEVTDDGSCMQLSALMVPVTCILGCTEFVLRDLVRGFKAHAESVSKKEESDTKAIADAKNLYYKVWGVAWGVRSLGVGILGIFGYKLIEFCT